MNSLQEAEDMLPHRTPDVLRVAHGQFIPAGPTGFPATGPRGVWETFAVTRDRQKGTALGTGHADFFDPLIAPHFDTSALVTIDTQTDTLDGQPLEIPGTSAVVPNIRALCRAFRAAARPIAHIVRLYLADGSNAEPVRRSLVTGPTPVLRPGSDGRLLAPGLAPEGSPTLDDDLLLSGGMQELGPNEFVLYKPRWGAFFGTRLDELLLRVGADTVVFTGCNFPNCPRTSIYEASERDYRAVLVDDAISGLYDIGRREMANIGVSVLQTSDVVSMLMKPTRLSRDRTRLERGGTTS